MSVFEDFPATESCFAWIRICIVFAWIRIRIKVRSESRSVTNFFRSWIHINATLQQTVPAYVYRIYLW